LPGVADQFVVGLSVVLAARKFLGAGIAGASLVFRRSDGSFFLASRKAVLTEK
jgi:hypothetical protein